MGDINALLIAFWLGDVFAFTLVGSKIQAVIGLVCLLLTILIRLTIGRAA